MNPNKQPFYGRKISKVGINVTNATDNQLILKEDYNTGTLTYYGPNGPVTQFGLFADNTTYGQRILDASGKLVAQFGHQSDNTYALRFFDSSGNVVSQFGRQVDGSTSLKFFDTSGYTIYSLTGSTAYWYDKSTGKNIMQIGLLPDGTYGVAVAKVGYNVSDGIF
jgi:hypothetical protein